MPNERTLPFGLHAEEGSHLALLLESLSAVARQDLLAISELHTVPAGTVVIPEGERSDQLGYIVDGTLAMKKRLPDGRTHIIGLLVPTDLYGRIFDGASAYRIETLTEARLLSFDRAGFERILAGAPEVERMFLVEILDELDAAREWILLLGGRKVVERVASFLLILCRRRARELVPEPQAAGPVRVHIPISRTDLAQYLGARPESLSRALHELERVKAIHMNDPYDFELVDIARLVEIAGHDLITRDS